MAASAAQPQTIDPVPPQLPEEEFWEKYNRRLEFPLSTVGTVFLHVMVAAGLFLVLNYLIAKPENKEGVPMSFVDAGGLDDTGDGSEGGGGDESVIAISGEQPVVNLDTIPDPSIPNPTENQPNTKLPDPTSASNAKDKSAFATKGGQGTKGTGPGGSGKDLSRARQENWTRWVISFNTFEGDGKDYLYQMGTFGATVIVARQDPNQVLVYSDVKNSTDGRSMSLAEAQKTFAGYRWFSEDPSKYSDSQRHAKSVRTISDVARALKLDYVPEKFWAAFPKEVDQMMADRENAFIARVRAETQFNSLGVDDIHTTVFAVDRRGGGKDVEIARMLLKDEKTVIVVQNGRMIVRGR